MSLRGLFVSFLIGLSWCLVRPELTFAQLTVQQPAFGVNSVSTTVSVPDRGRAHLGSLSRARDSRSRFGPFRSGTHLGIDREHTGMSVGVYIHDFEAMDRYLLNQASAQRKSNSPLTGNARHAWRQLQAEQGPAASTSRVGAPAVSKADKYWRLGQKAEEQGKLPLARLHYRIAAKHGSSSAKARLADLSSAQENTSVAGTSQ